MIYFDNAATTAIKPRKVLRETLREIKTIYGNPGRGSHKLSLRAGEKIYDTRETICEFISAKKPENVIFTYNATYALNIAIKTLITEKCHIIISDLEHNSVYRPIISLCEKYGCEYSVFNTSKGNLEKEIIGCIRNDTKAIVSTVSSNVNGRTVPLSILSKVKEKYRLKLIVDASQFIGHRRIDLSVNPCDALCAPAHKALFGLPGVGFVYFDDETGANTFIEGGSGNESLNPKMPDGLPEKYEAGTISVQSIASLDAGIKYINRLGIGAIEEKIDFLTKEAIARIGDIRGLKFLDGNNGVISFTFNMLNTEDIAARLNSSGILVRAGLHCAPCAHKTLGTLSTGTVRVSLSILNNIKELDKLYRVLMQISR